MTLYFLLGMLIFGALRFFISLLIYSISNILIIITSFEERNRINFLEVKSIYLKFLYTQRSCHTKEDNQIFLIEVTSHLRFQKRIFTRKIVEIINFIDIPQKNYLEIYDQLRLSLLQIYSF